MSILATWAGFVKDASSGQRAASSTVAFFSFQSNRTKLSTTSHLCNNLSIELKPGYPFSQNFFRSLAELMTYKGEHDWEWSR